MPPEPSDQELDRYARHIVLRQVGGAGQNRLRGSRVLMIGAGGIGCPAATALVAAGVGAMTIVDDDVVELSNLQRQTLFADSDVGQRKAEVAASALTRLNAHVKVTPQIMRVDATNAAALIAGHDLILDGCDNFATRLAVSDAATKARIPLVSAAIGQFQGQVGTFRGWVPDRPCYRCFVGDAFDSEDCDSCAELGVLGAASAIIGNWAALEAIRALAGFEGDGRLLVIDLLGPVLRPLKIVKDPACRGCGVTI